MSSILAVGGFNVSANLTALCIVILIATVMLRKVKKALVIGIISIIVIILVNFVLPNFSY